VVMDNLTSHKVVGVREAIEEVGADIWYLPAYSPDLNPSKNCGPKSRPGYAGSRLELSTHSSAASATPFGRSMPTYAEPTYAAADTLQLSVKCSSHRSISVQPFLAMPTMGNDQAGAVR